MHEGQTQTYVLRRVCLVLALPEQNGVVAQWCRLVNRRSKGVYLAYLDDSGTRDKGRTFQVLSAVIIEDKEFSNREVVMGAAIEAILPHDRLDTFEEFHAFELFGG